MLYRFKSKNMGDIIMLESNGRHVLEIIGKEPAPQGIILPEDIPAAIAALQTAIALEESNAKAAEGGAAPGRTIDLRQRAQPFIEMLHVNHAANEAVLWGV
jgi:hypothetical protein